MCVHACNSVRDHRLSGLGSADPDVAIGEATIAAVHDLAPAQLLSAVTPERIGELTGYSASSVRYRLNVGAGRPGVTAHGSSRGWSFDREALLLTALRAYRLRMRAVLAETAERYERALAAFEAGDSMVLEAALESTVSSAGPAAQELAAGAERLYLVALAACDASPAIAQLLHEVEDDRREQLRTLTLRGLRALGREPRPELTVDAISDTVHHYLGGLATRRRFHPGADRGALLPTVLAIVLAFTEAAPGATVAPAVAEALASLGLGA